MSSTTERTSLESTWEWTALKSYTCDLDFYRGACLHRPSLLPLGLCTRWARDKSKTADMDDRIATVLLYAPSSNLSLEYLRILETEPVETAEAQPYRARRVGCFIRLEFSRVVPILLWLIHLTAPPAQNVERVAPRDRLPHPLHLCCGSIP